MKKNFVKYILIALAGVVVIGLGGYLVVNRIADQKIQRIQDEEAQKQEKAQMDARVASTTAEIENLKKELVNLKKKEEVALKVSVTNVRLTNAEIIAKVKPAVVYIETQSGIGTGMIIDSDGYVLTNAHVVAGALSARVSLQDGRTVNAVITGRNEIIDLAVLKISLSNLPYVALEDSSIVKQGDEVFTLGYPFGIKGDVSFKEGTISRRISDGSVPYFETSAEIHPGNSGGPLVNRTGKVVGINTAAFGQKLNIPGVEQGALVGETIKLAIEINTAKNLLGSLKNGSGTLVWSKKASGKITIYNMFSTEPQRLILSTRFESPDGRIYRLAQSVIVPGKRVVNGQDEPGQIEAIIIADVEGPEYNISPSKFTIPGFKDSERFNFIWGETKESITTDLE